jgi:steroid 5-alpha reductase family enzyme
MVVLVVAAVTIALSLAMMLAWLLQHRTGNAGWVDVVWSFSTGAAGVAYTLLPGPGLPLRKLLLAMLFAAWSLRLGLHIAARTRTGEEDSRYTQFRREWGTNFERRMFGFLQIQAAAAALLGAAVLLAARNPAPLAFSDALGVLVLATAIAGEATADAQLRRFRADAANRGRICDTGLWRLSRHPNYFFEWFGWLAYPLFAIDWSGAYLWGWFAVIAPAFMYWLLVHVSGVPPLEAQMLRSRGTAYAAYQARTRPFVPLPMKE